MRLSDIWSSMSSNVGGWRSDSKHWRALVLSWVTAAILPPRYKQIQGFPWCCGGDSRKCIGKRHLHRPAGALRIRLAALPTPELWGLYRRPAGCRVCGSLGLVIARTSNTTSLVNTRRGFLGASRADCWCGDTCPELELGRFSNQLSTGGEGVARRKLVYRWAGVGHGQARAGGGGRGQMTCGPRVDSRIRKNRAIHMGKPAVRDISPESLPLKSKTCGPEIPRSRPSEWLRVWFRWRRRGRRRSRGVR